MSAEATLRKHGVTPWTVGAKDAVCVVGIQGEITALDRETSTITIAGHTLPTTLGNGVRLLSMTFEGAEGDGAECTREHVNEWSDDEAEYKAEFDALIDALTTMHDDEHDGAFRFCDNRFCRVANGGAA